jgi:hypothetical protein
MQDIVIIGGGWYGCHIAKVLQDRYNVILIEKQVDIFDNSSYYNQNRLHLGYHYCRDFNTRSMCKDNFDRFSREYPECIDVIDRNYYLISKNSILDYQTYVNIYKGEGFDFDETPNIGFSNVSGNMISTGEQVIHSEKSKMYFKDHLKNTRIHKNTEFEGYSKDADGKILVKCKKTSDYGSYMREFTCDLLLDCTYNQLELSKKNYKYELTISLLYKKLNDDPGFGAITVMDGKFFSLYPRDISQNIYTLTDVEFTPIISSNRVAGVDRYEVSEEEIEDARQNMETKVNGYYPNFLEDFEYISHFLSKKTKMLSASDSRDITIEEVEKGVITVNCGKIYGIFEFEDYVLEYINVEGTSGHQNPLCGFQTPNPLPPFGEF